MKDDEQVKVEELEKLWSILHDSEYTDEIVEELSRLKSVGHTDVLEKLNDRQKLEERRYRGIHMVALWVKRLRDKGFEMTEKMVQDAHEYCSVKAHGKSYYYWSLASVFASMKSSSCVPLSQKAFLSKLGVHKRFSPRHFRYVSGLDDLETVAVQTKSFRRAFAMIYQKFDLNSKVCNLRPTIFVSALCKKMKVKNEVRREANRMAKKVVESKIHIGRHPLALASAIVYIVEFAAWQFDIVSSEKRKTMRYISSMAGINEVTLRNSVHFIQDNLALGCLFDTKHGKVS